MLASTSTGCLMDVPHGARPGLSLSAPCSAPSDYSRRSPDYQLRKRMRNYLLDLSVKLLLRKRAMIETSKDQLKNS
jgi:hypothetical protein